MSHLRLETGIVASVVSATEEGRELLVEVNAQLERAWQEPAFGVPAELGDTVLLNTTAMRLGLGTGGTHFVLAVQKNHLSAAFGVTAPHDKTQTNSSNPPGHIMKLRYTPLQIAVHAVEEPDHPAHDTLRDADSLGGMPVVICELHSMLPAVAMTLHHELTQDAIDPTTTAPVKIAYVMTDGAALPMHFSKTVAVLKEKGLLAGTVTVGHAYGGDLEAVNLYSGLLAARHVLQADVIVVAMGPGIVGTGTRFGHTGIEVGQAVNAVHALEGDAIVVPRLSFADARERHRGVSHHTLTALGRVALAQATVPLPNLDDEAARLVWQQVSGAGLHQKHRLVGVSGKSILDAAARYQVPLRTMGRNLQEDPAFFLASGAAGEWVARQMKNPPRRYARRVDEAVLTDKN
jgi:hypothetical protein